MERQKFPTPDPIELSMMDSFKSEGFLIINQTLIKQIGLVATAFLGNCIDNFNKFREQNPINDGWFPLTYQQQENQLHLGKGIIKEAKEEAKRQGFLETKIIGCPAKEWYRLNMKGFEFLYTTKTPPQFYYSGARTAPQEILISTSQAVPDLPKKTKKTIEKSQFTPTDRLPGSGMNINNNKIYMLYLPPARYLSRIINTQKNYKHTPNQIKSWANEFRILSETNNIPLSRIKAALKWYAKNIGGQYVPVIESGKAFRTKFINLEAAMDREKHPFKVNNPNQKQFKEYDGIRYNLCPDGYYRSAGGEEWIE